MASKTGEQILMGILAYLGLLVIIPLLVKKDDAWVKKHSQQGLALLIVWVVAWVASLILAFIPVIGWGISMVVWVLLLIVWIIEIIKVVQGNDPWTIPVIGEMAKGWNF